MQGCNKDGSSPGRAVRGGPGGGPLDELKPHRPGAPGQATSSLGGGLSSLGEQAQGVRGEKVQTQRVTEVSVCGGGTGVPP